MVTRKNPKLISINVPGFLQKERKTHELQFSIRNIYMTLESSKGCKIDVKMTFGPLKSLGQ
jgi:hypothetical protein